jgi:alpha-amylase/alpha-mannosidase (GH57 family)
MDRYICIHGHFYQPPRENPWLEVIELQDSAYPYHDWNERITAECYAPNATSRILDGDGRILQLVNNYSRISFNFGPTLLAWLEGYSKDVYQAILEADSESQRVFSGHGSALAQAYNHMILPLANRRDKQTQIVWGIKDFRKRFQRYPEGMWLPEAAVDLETLDVLAEHEIRFTVLAPRQALRIRPSGAKEWEDVSQGTIDPTRAYKVSLASGRSISVFFYDAPISLGLAFEGLLNNGEELANRLVGAFSEERSWPQIVNVATDGESYGHHHKYGDMALAYALDYVETRNLAKLTNYGEYLEKHPPTHEVDIFENSSWSCVHGVDRWRGDCGCNSGGHAGWNQAWRAPLRDALDWLRDSMAPEYEEKAATLLKNPWEARQDFIEIILDRSPETLERFLAQHATGPLSRDDTTLALKLLELQRHLMLMYTSCGWFFDELSGLETAQVIQYAGRALQLAKDLSGNGIEARFLEMLEQAKSNIPEHRNGRVIYEKWVEPAVLDLTRVGAHYAISSLFEEYEEASSIFSYTATREDYKASLAGRAKLAVGRATLTSTITLESARLNFGVLHLGDHNINCGVGESRGEGEFPELVKELDEAFETADFPETIRLLDRHFGTSTYSLTSLFRDEQRRVLGQIMEPTLAEAEAAYGLIYEHHAPLIRFVRVSGMPVPGPLQNAADYVLNVHLNRAFQEAPIDLHTIDPLLEEIDRAGATMDADTLEFSLRHSMEAMAHQLAESPRDPSLLRSLDVAAGLVDSLPFQVNIRQVQNVCYRVLEKLFKGLRQESGQGDPEAQELVELFSSLAQKLRMVVPQDE